MSIKVWPLLIGLTIVEWLLLTQCLVIQVVELLTDGQDVVCLLRNNVLTLAIGVIEDR